MADSRFGKTRGIQTKDLAERPVIDRIKELTAAGKTRQQALDTVAQERKTSLQKITRIAERHGL